MRLLYFLTEFEVIPRGPGIASCAPIGDEGVMHEPSVAETVRAIREYLRKNPNAQDTQAGILQWWLTNLPNKPRDATVKQALEELVHDGFLSEHKGKDAQISYRMKNPPP